MEKTTPQKTTLYGIEFRSKLEARWAWFLTCVGIDWIYEPTTFPVGYEGGDRRYTPDFYLPDLDIWLEVKGVMDDDSMARILMGVDTAHRHLPTAWRGNPHVMVVGRIPNPGTRTCWPVLYTDTIGRVRWNFWTFDVMEGLRYVRHGQILSSPDEHDEIGEATDLPYNGRAMHELKSEDLKCVYANWWPPQIQHSFYRARNNNPDWWEEMKYAGVGHPDRVERVLSFA